MARQVAVIAKNLLFNRLNVVLSNAGWQACRASEYMPIPSHNDGQLIHAGLIQFSAADRTEIGRFRQLTCSHDQIEWIALVPEALLSDKSVCKLIKTHFQDFHTLPLDVPRLLCTLGHAHGKGQLDGVCNEPLGKNGQYGMIGSSKVMRKLYQHIVKIGDADAPF